MARAWIQTTRASVQAINGVDFSWWQGNPLLWTPKATSEYLWGQGSPEHPTSCTTYSRFLTPSPQTHSQSLSPLLHRWWALGMKLPPLFSSSKQCAISTTKFLTISVAVFCFLSPWESLFPPSLILSSVPCLPPRLTRSPASCPPTCMSLLPYYMKF